MNILITQGSSRLARSLAGHLAASHTVRLTVTGGEVAHGDAVVCDLHHDAATDELVSGVDAIIHVGYDPGLDLSDATALLDYYTRRTYNLLTSAANAGVERFIYLSTLRLLEDYEENLTVTERWRPLPPSEDAQLLACHLGEIVSKEFARDRLIDVATIRLGFPIVDGGRQAAADSGETAAVSIDDVHSVVDEALVAAIAPWQDIHVQSPVPEQRFLMHAARDLLGFPDGRG